MAARRFEDLIVWQLAYTLQEEVFAFTSKPPACKDFKYCNQIRESARSARKNIAEGFGRYYPREFVRFLRIAVGSLHETKDHLGDGHDRKYLDDVAFERLVRLTVRAIKAGNRLIAYLLGAKAPEPFRKDHNKQSQKNRDRREPSEPSEPREPPEPCEPREPT